MRAKGEDAGRQNYKDPGRFSGKLAYEVLVAGNMQPVPASEQVSILRDLFLRGTKRIRGISLCHEDRGFLGARC